MSKDSVQPTLWSYYSTGLVAVGLSVPVFIFLIVTVEIIGGFVYGLFILPSVMVWGYYIKRKQLFLHNFTRGKWFILFMMGYMSMMAGMMIPSYLSMLPFYLYGTVSPEVLMISGPLTLLFSLFATPFLQAFWVYKNSHVQPK